MPNSLLLKSWLWKWHLSHLWRTEIPNALHISAVLQAAGMTLLCCCLVKRKRKKKTYRIYHPYLVLSRPCEQNSWTSRGLSASSSKKVTGGFILCKEPHLQLCSAKCEVCDNFWCDHLIILTPGHCKYETGWATEKALILLREHWWNWIHFTVVVLTTHTQHKATTISNVYLLSHSISSLKLAAQ